MTLFFSDLHTVPLRHYHRSDLWHIRPNRGTRSLGGYRAAAEVPEVGLFAAWTDQTFFPIEPAMVDAHPYSAGGTSSILRGNACALSSEFCPNMPDT